ncbi:MAG: hypothetical protein H6711_34140 [Myxococcales bacterium]|nr:hypothetical protein [Myxococcales bacterium]
MPGLLTSDESQLDPKLFTWAQNKSEQKIAPYLNTTALGADLVAMANKTLLSDVPPEHLRGHVRLQKILRGTTRAITMRGLKVEFDPGQWANWFTAEDQCITINIPLKMKWVYKNMTKARGDALWSGNQGVFWARDRAHRKSMTDLILPWAFRHEFGHSIDYLTQFMNRFGSRREFGGWAAYVGGDYSSGPRDRRKSMIQDILTGVCRERSEIRRSLDDTAKMTSAANSLIDFASQEDKYTSATFRATIKSNIAAIGDSRARSHMERVWEIIDAGSKQPWLSGSLLEMLVVDGRVYSFNAMDGAWHSFCAAAYRERVSNYQFASPAEWFAEYYSARYGEKSGPAMYKTLRDNMPKKSIDEADRLLAADCDTNTKALKAFLWSDIPDLSKTLSAKQLKHIESCTRGRRKDGTFYIASCKACMTEYSGANLRLGSRSDILGANVLCTACTQALTSCDLLTQEVKPLCTQCTSAINASNKLKVNWSYLCGATKTPVVPCTRSHWTPTPIDSVEGLIPCPWY